MDLIERLRRRLDEMDGVKVFGHRDAARRVGTLSFRSEALPAAELGGILDSGVRHRRPAGTALLSVHPPRPRHLRRRPDGTVRVSTGPFNTAEDVDALAAALAEIVG